MNKITPVKAFTAVRPDGEVVISFTRATEEWVWIAIGGVGNRRRDEGWRVIPVIITPAEEEGRREDG